MKSYHLLLILFVVFASCETILEVDIPREAPKLVVNAELIADSTMKVFLTNSHYILEDTFYANFDNATIAIFEDGAFKEQLQKTEEYGLYISQFTLKEGKTYTLKAEAPGFAPVEATHFLVPKVPIQMVVLDSTINSFDQRCDDDTCYNLVNYQVDLTFQDPADIANYYSITGYFINTYSSTRQYPDGSSKEVTIEEKWRLFLYSEDVSLALRDFDIEGNGQSGIELLFSDELFDGKTYTFSFAIENNFYPRHPAQELTLIFEHLSEAWYKYRVSRRLQIWKAGDPFAEPVPVYNNIENGYGIFAGYSADTKIVKP